MKLSDKESLFDMRLQVFLSHNGVCSRRKAMDLVKSGRIMLNGKIVKEPSTSVNPNKDKVYFDRKLVSPIPYSYIVLNKPRGYVSTKSDRFASKTVLELLPPSLQHVNPVGRLDKDTEGLLLLTNDGDLTLKLTHPSFGVDKVYLVNINGFLTGEQQLRLQKGVMLNRKKTAPAKIKDVRIHSSGTQFFMTIHEGQKRQIRLMMQEVGHNVVYLQRLRQGAIELGNLPKGRWRYLTTKEINSLKNKSKRQ